MVFRAGHPPTAPCRCLYLAVITPLCGDYVLLFLLTRFHLRAFTVSFKTCNFKRNSFQFVSKFYACMLLKVKYFFNAYYEERNRKFLGPYPLFPVHSSLTLPLPPPSTLAGKQFDTLAVPFFVVTLKSLSNMPTLLFLDFYILCFLLLTFLSGR